MVDKENGLTRMKKNQVCRQIFASHNIDLDFLSIQNTTKSLHLSGKLVKLNKQPCTPEEIIQILERLKKVTRFLTTDLENWDLNNWEIKKINKKIEVETTHVVKRLTLRAREEEEDDDLIIDLG